MGADDTLELQDGHLSLDMCVAGWWPCRTVQGAKDEGVTAFVLGGVCWHVVIG